jgi:hypothetical protein
MVCRYALIPARIAHRTAIDEREKRCAVLKKPQSNHQV